MLTAEQIDIRHSGIGASELPAVLGMDPYQTPIDLWAVKTGLVAGDAGNINTRLGDLMEPVLLTLYGEMRSAVVYPSPGTLRHHAEPWLLATPDAVAAPARELAIDRVVEVKHRGHWNRAGWGVAGTDEVPDSVAIQVHAQLAVTGFPFGDVAVLIGGGDLRFYRVHADEVLVATMLEMGREFWTRYVLGRQMPPATAADNETLGRLLRQSTEDLRPALPDIDEDLLTLRDVRRELDELGQTKEELEARLKAFIGDSAGIASATGKCTWRQAKDSVVTDWKALAAAAQRPDLIPQFTTTKPGSRRFLVTFPEGEVTA
jgi:putative phage-type endonuclease